MEDNKKLEPAENKEQELKEAELEDVNGGIIYFMSEAPKPKAKADT